MDDTPIDLNPAGAEQAPEAAPTVDVNKWLNRIKESEKYMREKFKPRYDLARKRMRSELEAKKQKGGYPSHDQVSMLYSIGVNYVNSVYFKAPNCNLTARNDQESEQVENTEIKVNDWLKDKKVKATIKRIVMDAFLGGFGARYLDYEYRDYESGQAAMGDDGQPMMGEDGQPLMERVQVINQPVLQRIRPDLVRFPRGFNFDNYQESPWIGFDLLMPVEEIQADKELDPNLTALIRGSKFDDISDKEQKVTTQASDDIMWARLHYIFEKPKNEGEYFKMLVLCDETKEAPLRMMDYDKGCIGYPVKFLKHNPQDDDETYPCGDAWMMESQLAAIDTWWRTLVNHVKRSLPQVLVNKNMIKGVDMQNLKKTEDLHYVPLDTGGQPWELLIKMLEKPQIHPDTNLLYNSARSIVSEVGPKSGLTRGTEDSNIKTATEAKIASTGEMIDLEARIDDIREFLIDIVLDVAGLYEKNFQGVTNVKGTLDDGTEIERDVDRSGFTSRINADVDVETMQAPNREVYRRQLMDAFGMMKLFEKDLAKKKKALDGEWIAQKMADSFGIRNFDKAIVDLDIRDPGREVLEFVFKGVPFVVQDGEVFEDHLMQHQSTLQDEIQAQAFEQFRPGFVMALQQHMMETQAAMQKQQAMEQPPKQVKNPVTGQRPEMATEMTRANQV